MPRVASAIRFKPYLDPLQTQSFNIEAQDIQDKIWKTAEFRDIRLMLFPYVPMERIESYVLSDHRFGFRFA
ncbi:MAG: hypothetical protein WCI03_12375 [bacterium]|jgi:hypothetical protein